MRVPVSPAAHGRAAQVVGSGPLTSPTVGHKAQPFPRFPTSLLQCVAPRHVRQPATEGGAGTPEGRPRQPGERRGQRSLAVRCAGPGAGWAGSSCLPAAGGGSS